jgi:hypothetical protein
VRVDLRQRSAKAAQEVRLMPRQLFEKILDQADQSDRANPNPPDAAKDTALGVAFTETCCPNCAQKGLDPDPRPSERTSGWSVESEECGIKFAD